MRQTAYTITFLWMLFWALVSFAQSKAAPLPPEVTDWNAKEILFHTVFFVLIFGVPTILVWLSYSDKDIAAGFDISALWKTEDGHLDKLFIIVLGTWWLHFCAVTLWTLSRTVVTADFVTFMGWGIPIVARMFVPGQPKPAGEIP